jgi:hypothetical protein
MLSGIIVSIAFHICMKRGMLFWKYKMFLMTRLKSWRDIIRSYGSTDEGIEWLVYRAGAKCPILKPLGLCSVCTSFWIGLIFTESFIYACLTMILMYFFTIIEKNYLK